jgi:hypothetical protein
MRPREDARSRVRASLLRQRGLTQRSRPLNQRRLSPSRHKVHVVGLRLARYLREFVGLRSTTVYDLNKYESVLWFGDMPQERECQSPAWNNEFEAGDPWLVVHKQQFPKPPVPPEIILPWIDQQALKRAAAEIPKLQPTSIEPDLGAEIGEGEEPP